jgi:hypothetical protein
VGTLKRTRHDARDHKSGRYESTPKCDGCNKPIGTNYFTDSDVCGGTDGPGFYVCDRARCQKKLEGLGVEERRAVYEAMRQNRESRSLT